MTEPRRCPGLWPFKPWLEKKQLQTEECGSRKGLCGRLTVRGVTRAMSCLSRSVTSQTPALLFSSVRVLLFSVQLEKSLETFQLSELCISRIHSGPCLLSTLGRGLLALPRPFQNLHTLTPLTLIFSPELWSQASTGPFDICICVPHEHLKLRIPQTEPLLFIQ